jgi:hypothetical protein
MRGQVSVWTRCTGKRLERAGLNWGALAMKTNTESAQSVDLLTVIGLSLLLLPLLTMAHEIGGHASACTALGGQVTELGAYYVHCKSQTEGLSKLVSIAGTVADLVVFLFAFYLWKRSASDLMRLACWLAFVGKAMAAAGYLFFSGFTGVGDWAPGEQGGIGPLQHAEPIRVLLIVVGLAAYVFVVRLAKRTLTEMVGGAPDAAPNRKRIALGYYFATGVAAILIGILNPTGMFVLLFSAIASSFGGNAGMLSVAFDRSTGPGNAFHIERSIPLLLAGIAATGLFAILFGPTISLD